ncbi:MAG TPA: peptide deformylase [Armatimonadetes bacterium]|nr:peptide deformylase [Armatimonadota bacterium]
MLDIVLYGDPILRRRAKPVKSFTGRTRTLIKRMLEAMKAAKGIGLAAPQVGVSERIIVISTNGEDLALINPRIVGQEGRQVDIEGCLSFPGLQGEVPRSRQVVVEAFNPLGRSVRVTAEGLRARAIQHEIDHLNGVLFIDRAREDSLHWLVREKERDEEGKPRYRKVRTTLEEVEEFYRRMREGN